MGRKLKDIWTMERWEELWVIQRGGVKIYADEFLIYNTVVKFFFGGALVARMDRELNLIKDKHGEVIA